MLKLILIFSFVTLSLSLALKPGCPRVEPVPVDFTSPECTPGMWYQLAKYPHNIETLEKCVGYYIAPKGTGFEAETNTSIKKASYCRVEGTLVDNTRRVFNLTAWTETPHKVVNVPELHYLAFERNFFVAYGCIYDLITDDYREYAWIFSRTTNVAPEIKDKIENIISSNDAIDMKKLIWIDHSGCEAQ